MSLTRFFDIHPSPQNRCQFQYSRIILFCRFFAPCRTPTAHSATSTVDPGTKRGNNLHTEFVINGPHGETHSVTSNLQHTNSELETKALHRESRCVFQKRKNASHKRGLERSYAGEVRTYDPPLFHRVAQARLHEGSDGVQFSELSLLL